ncbi:hypothetical protein CHS0354_029063 [Potamilus streckersoni]|uniref:CYTH domain-containing protein n=1 Tax=Potamilus streckersoni TaxID=2493646 RepID=A0AAE0SSD2_9BIVA|nr:hypothetical protein CHS0354_029063 [Potamilus streckersoni]
MATGSSVDPELKLDIPENQTYVDHIEYKITSPDRERISTSRVSITSEFSSSQASSEDVEKSMSLQETVASNATFDTNSNFIVSSQNECDESNDQILTDPVVLSDASTSLERSVDRIERKCLIDETDKIVSPVKLVEDLSKFAGEDILGRTAPLASLELDDDLDITVSSQCKLENTSTSENINRNRDPDDLNNNLEVLTMPQQREENVVEERPSESSFAVSEMGNRPADKENREGDLSQGHIVEVKQQSKEDEKTGEVVVITETITEEVEKETVHVTEIEEVWEYVADSNHGVVIRKKNVVSQKEADEVNLKTLRKSHITTERHRKYTDDEAKITSEVSIPNQVEIEVQEKSSITAPDTESQGINKGEESDNKKQEEQEIAELSRNQAEIDLQDKPSFSAPDTESQEIKGEESEHKKQSCEEQEITELSAVTAGLSLQENIMLFDSEQRPATYESQGSNFQIEETQQLLSSVLIKKEKASEIVAVGADPVSEMECDQNSDKPVGENKVQRSREGNQKSASLSSAEDSRAMIIEKEAEEVSLGISNISHITTEGHKKQTNYDMDKPSEVSVQNQDEIVVQEKSSITSLERESQEIKKVGELEQGRNEQEFAESSDAKIKMSLQENVALVDNQKRPATCESQGDNLQIVEAEHLLLSMDLVKEEIVHEIVTVETRLVSEIVTNVINDTLTAEHKVLGSDALNAEGSQISESESTAQDSRSITDQQISIEHNIPAPQDPGFVVFEQSQIVQLHHNQLLASSDISSHTQSEQKQVLHQDGQIKQDNEKNEGIVNYETDRNQAEIKPIQIKRMFKTPMDCETKVVKLGGSMVEEKLYNDIYYDDVRYSLTLRGSWLRQRNGKWQLLTEVSRVPYEEDSNEKEIVKFLTKHYNCSEKGFKESILALVHELGLTEFSNFITIQKHYKMLNCTISLELTDFGFQVGEIAVKVASPAETPSALQIIDNMANDLGFQPLQMETL